MGGIWVDYELQTTIKGLFAIGECNFSDHGANRLGASALMQGLADGYFVLPYTIQNYLSDQITVPRFSTDLPEFAEAEKAVQAKIDHLMNIKGKKSVDSIHKELGRVMWEYVGMRRYGTYCRRLEDRFGSSERNPQGIRNRTVYPWNKRRYEHRA